MSNSPIDLVRESHLASGTSLRLVQSFLEQLYRRACAKLKDPTLSDLLRQVGSPYQSWLLASNDAIEMREEIQAELGAFSAGVIQKSPFVPKWAQPALDGEAGYERQGNMPELEFRPYSEACKYYQAAIEVMREVWPEASNEYHATISRVLFYKDPLSIAGSAPQSFGAIYLGSHTDDPVTYANALIHETGHHLLNVLRAIDPILAGPPDQLVYSGLRGVKRPVWRTVHAAYSMTRMTAFLRRATQTLKGTNAEIAQKLLREMHTRQVPTLAGLKEVAWTHVGLILLTQMIDLSSEIEQELLT